MGNKEDRYKAIDVRWLTIDLTTVVNKQKMVWRATFDLSNRRAPDEKTIRYLLASGSYILREDDSGRLSGKIAHNGQFYHFSLEVLSSTDISARYHVAEPELPARGQGRLHRETGIPLGAGKDEYID